MRNLLIIALLALFISSCATTDCEESDIRVIIKFDSTTSKLYYKVSQYEKASDYSSFVKTTYDSVSAWKTDSGHWICETSFTISAGYDWVIEFPATAKTYKISDIYYGGKKKMSELHVMGEYKTRCFRETHYSMNGSAYTIERGTYEKGYSYRNPEITITK